MTYADPMPARLDALHARMGAHAERGDALAAAEAVHDEVWPHLRPLALRQSRLRKPPRNPLPAWVMDRLSKEMSA